MKYTPIKSNFTYPDFKGTEFKFGSNELVGKILRPDRDWRNYLPPEEEQKRHGVESAACFIEAQQHTIATILEEQYGIIDSNFSARYNLNFTDASEFGGSPIDGAQSIRHHGLIPDERLPFSEDIASWDEFRSFKGSNKALCEKVGKEWLAGWIPQFDVIFKMEEQLEIKHAKLEQSLFYCPPPISVAAWYEENGIYFKPPGVPDNHLAELVYVDEEGYFYVRDTYPPFLKKLDKDYNFDFAMRWIVNKNLTPDNQPSLWELIVAFLQTFFKKYAK